MIMGGGRVKYPNPLGYATDNINVLGNFNLNFK